MIALPEVIIRLHLSCRRTAAKHRLKHEHVAADELVKHVERKQWMAQVIEHTHEQDDIEHLPKRRKVVHRHLAELDVESGDLSGKARLRQVSRVAVDADHLRRSTTFHLDRVEPAVAADVENGATAKIGRDRMRKVTPFDRRVVSEKMIGRGLHTLKVDVVEPVTKLPYPSADIVRCQCGGLRPPHPVTRSLAGPRPPHSAPEAHSLTLVRAVFIRLHLCCSVFIGVMFGARVSVGFSAEAAAAATNLSSSTARCIAVCAVSTRRRARKPIRFRCSSEMSRRYESVSDGRRAIRISSPGVKNVSSPGQS